MYRIKNAVEKSEKQIKNDSIWNTEMGIKKAHP
jgi:hypothetical protein